MFFRSAAHEYAESFKHPYLWALLAWYDIKQRYRRSVLGPFWLTISTAILIGTLGFLWSTLFKTDIKEYLPYFAAGNIIWSFVSMQLNECVTGFTQFEHLIKQTRLPYPAYILRLLARNFIIFLHNFVIVILVISFYGAGWHWVALLAIPGMLLLNAVLFGASMIFSVLCTRYRDLVPVVQSVVTVSYFLSPIMWQTKILPEDKRWMALANPITHLLDIVRKPLLGQAPSLLNWAVSLGLLLLASGLAYYVLARARNRISYWI